MPYLLVHHHVEDYNRWKPVFDEHGSARESYGCLGGQVFRSAADPNEVVILLEWDDLNNARAFAQSPGLREAMQRAGVQGPPEVIFLDLAATPRV